MFNYIISNPPYQDKKNSAIFHLFHLNNMYLSNKIIMIYPAQKWFLKSGKGKNINDYKEFIFNNGLKELIIYNDVKEVFPNIELHGGISIVYTNKLEDNKNFLFKTINNSILETRIINRNIDINKLGLRHILNDIVLKVNNKDNNKKTLADIIMPQGYYNIDSKFISNHPDVILTDSNSDIPDGYVKILANNKPGKQGRAKWYHVDKTLLNNIEPETYSNYRIALFGRHSSGAEGRSQQLYVYPPNVLFGDFRIGIFQCNTQEEASNFLKWVTTPIIRILCYSSSMRIKNFGINVPLLDSYKNDNDFIDFDNDINKQLSDYYLLTTQENKYITELLEGFGSPFQDI